MFCRKLKIKNQKSKKISYFYFLLFTFLFFTSCTTSYNPATNKQETLMHSTDKEVNIGSKIAEQIESKYELNTDIDVNERVQRILDDLIPVSDRGDVVYFIKVLNEEDLNAVSLPGGYIYVFQGVMDAVESDDELAGVIAHEMGHISARHSMKRLQASYGALLLQLLSMEGGADVAGGVNLAVNSIFMEYSQQDEFEADKLSVKYMRAAGYDPQGIITFLERLKEEQEKAPIRRKTFWRTHPYLSQRIAKVNQEITGKLEFKDYLNLIDTREVYE